MAAPTRAGRLMRGLVLTALCGCLGLLAGLFYGFAASATVDRPAPHRVPPWPGATPLSVAMVYDVIHGLHPAHSAAWHRAVERRSRATLAAAPPQGPLPAATLDAYDDLAVALDRLGRPAEALEVMQDKTTRLAATWPEPPPAAAADAEPLPTERLSPDRRAWYRTRANRGTVMIHGALPRLMAQPDDAEARRAVEAGLADIRASIALHPGAHFGREQWQARLVVGLLDSVGDPLWWVDNELFGMGYGTAPFERARTGLSGLPTDAELAAGLTPEQRRRAREQVPIYIAETPWVDAERGAVQPVPFDEPALAVIGMWLYGGGPNPHFAAALARMMQRIRQPYVAWAAYARALELADRFGPARLMEVPRIEAEMARLADELGQTEDELYDAFHAERARGRAFRAAQAEFEAGLDDPLAPGALDPFFAGRPSISTPPGQADRLWVQTSGADDPWTLLAFALWFAAVGALLAARQLRSPAER